MNRQDILNFLSTCTRLRTHAHFACGGITDILDGSVQVLQSSNHMLLMQEEGVWRKRQITAQNRYMWQAESNGLALYRHQQDRLTRLCHFTHDNHWTDTHECSPDTYRGTIELGAEALRLIWHISGPAKQGILTCCYGGV